jgi:hypothetical protein
VPGFDGKGCGGGMGFARQAGILVTVAILLGGAEAVRAQDTEGTLTTLTTCDGVAPDQARAVADEARRGGQFHRAAECYLLAGEPVEADRALAKAFAEASVTNTKKASATLEDAKLQARRLREAFRGRPESRVR